MRSLLRFTVILVGLSLLSIVPFLLLGSTLDAKIQAWLTPKSDPLWFGTLTTILLVADIFLPIPSSVLGTLLGSRLGWISGGLLCWVGLTLGTIAGYLTSRGLGLPIVKKLCDAREIETARVLVQRYGAIALVITRGIPVLGEVMIFVAGLYRLQWWRFILPVAAANLGLSLSYATLGQLAQAHGWLSFALTLAAALPVVALLSVRKLLHAAPELNRAPEIEGADVEKKGNPKRA